MDQQATISFQGKQIGIAEAIMLTYPDVSKPFILYMDANDYAMVGLLAPVFQETHFNSTKLHCH